MQETFAMQSDLYPQPLDVLREVLAISRSGGQDAVIDVLVAGMTCWSSCQPAVVSRCVTRSRHWFVRVTADCGVPVNCA